MELLIILMVTIVIIQLQYVIMRGGNTASKLGRKSKQVLIDTSALMDGRILTAAQTGFIPHNLLIPKSVVAELQLLADQADSEKRSRARHGLDVISSLREMGTVRVEIYNDDFLQGGVDERLVILAKKLDASICTIDFNLNKVAKANELFVLNLNELAQSIRMAFLPGETISIALQQKGQDSHQAVGYLADGTMVVIEKAAKHIGETVEIEFIRSLQTAAGRMMFAKLTKSADEPRTQISKHEGDVVATLDQKPRGRKPSAKSTSTKNGDTTSPSPRKKSAPKSRRPRNNEDSLIDLVNSQDSPR